MPRIPVTKSPYETAELEDDTLLNAKIIEKAIDVLTGSVKLDRTFNIPYLAGYSIERGMVYIDCNLPELTMKNADGEEVKLDRFLILHETTEKALIDAWQLYYQHAHQIALRVEKSAVEAAGLEWETYDALMMEWVKKIANEKITRVPVSLDLTPYIDEAATDLLQKMYRAMVKEK